MRVSRRRNFQQQILVEKTLYSTFILICNPLHPLDNHRRVILRPTMMANEHWARQLFILYFRPRCVLSIVLFSEYSFVRQFRTFPLFSFFVQESRGSNGSPTLSLIGVLVFEAPATALNFIPVQATSSFARRSLDEGDFALFLVEKLCLVIKINIISLLLS